MAGVFVLVTIGLSTVSVVTSILINRLSGVSRPLPGWIRAGAFGVLARITCVHFSGPSEMAVAPVPDGGRRSASKPVTLTDVESADAGNNNCFSKEIGNKIDDLLYELRKVGRFCNVIVQLEKCAVA